MPPKRLKERGATASEAIQTVRSGARRAAKFGRFEFIKRFPFDRTWLGKKYKTKQIYAFAA